MKDLCSQYGFFEKPFTRELSIDKRFRLPWMEEAVQSLLATVQDRQSAALIAPAGTGKSTILRALCSQLPDARFRLTYLKVTSLGRRDMCREISYALGCQASGTLPLLHRRIQEHFLQLTDQQSLRPVLIIDESHELKADVLGMLKLLTNFEMDSRLVVSLVLCGQTPLKTLLRRDELQDITMRLMHYATLRPLSRAESRQYIEHRCRIAGAKEIPFDDAAFDAIFEFARGNLRANDCLSLKSLELAHQKDCRVVGTEHVIEARQLLWP